MGRGNYVPTLEHEKYVMFYVDKSAFSEESDYEDENCYVPQEDLEQQNYEDFKSNVVYDWMKKHKEFSKPWKDVWLERDAKVLLESEGMKMFIADNENSIALGIILEDFEDDDWNTVEEKEKDFLEKLNALEKDFKNTLAEYAGKENIRVRAGAWCSAQAF